MIANKEIMARNIKKYMNEKGVSQAEICKFLEIKQNTFSDWINAKTYPRIDSIQKMADYFNVSKSCLVEDVPLDFVLSEFETDLLLRYRAADSDTKNVIKRLLGYKKEE